MGDRQELCDTARNREAVGIVLDDIQMVGQVPDFLVHVKGLAEQVDHMAVLPLVLEVDFHVLREGLEVTVIPHKAYLINEDEGIWRELVLAKSIRRKHDSTGDFTVTVDIPAFLAVLKA